MEDRWEPMLGRVVGWVEAAAAVVALGGRDPSNALDDVLGPAGVRMLDDMASLLQETGTALSPEGREAVSLLLQERPRFAAALPIPAATRLTAKMRMFLGTFRYHLADREASWVATVERAFLHLDRMLVADPQVSERWAAALSKDGERGAEKLGGCHLLQHGIWAFKADAIGERTDLVLGTTLAFTARQRQAAEALVLTEWKLAKSEADVRDQVDVACKQARRYACGALAGFELRSVRYLVTVGTGRWATLPEFREGAVSYQHFHVAIDPGSPSADARKGSRSERPAPRRRSQAGDAR